ncbi:MAG: LamG domain-containing protein [Deltaproteobacteria bacterium]|nr:LamG domain-containing protein [Deltaproteobacteria bacterium]
MKLKLLAISLLVVNLALVFPIIGNAKELEGLVVYFTFDKGSGKTVIDHSGTGNDGEIKGGTNWTAGKYDGGLMFEGDDGLVEVADNDSLHFVDGLTIAAWIKPTLEGDEWQLIGSKGPDADEYFEVLLSPNGFIWMGWVFQAAGRIVPAQSPSNVKKDIWQHVAVAWDPKEFWTVYLDGEVLIDYPKQDDELVPKDDPLLLGTELNLKRYYNGIMDEWALFDRGLTQEEIKQIMGGIEGLMAVKPEAKLTTTWGNIKAKF